jgi:hypothetical protein
MIRLPLARSVPIEKYIKIIKSAEPEQSSTV